MLPNGNIWQPRLIFEILSDFWKVIVQIEILVETSVSHSGRHLRKKRRVLRTIEFHAAAMKNCFYTSNFHSEMHPATRFQNLTHLRHTRESQKQFGSSRFDIHFGSYFLESEFKLCSQTVIFDSLVWYLNFFQICENCLSKYKSLLKLP